jgi:hypothetical protein
MLPPRRFLMPHRHERLSLKRSKGAKTKKIYFSLNRARVSFFIALSCPDERRGRAKRSAEKKGLNHSAGGRKLNSQPHNSTSHLSEELVWGDRRPRLIKRSLFSLSVVGNTSIDSHLARCCVCWLLAVFVLKPAMVKRHVHYQNVD